jgi:hypothetical protein
LQNGQGSVLKTCRLSPRLAASNPPLEPITSVMILGDLPISDGSAA